MKIKISTAVQTGISHIQEGRPCQDYVATADFESNRCVAIADGAGGITHSEIGARLITKWAAQTFSQNFEDWFVLSEEQLKATLLDQSREYLSTQFSDVQADCTLLIFAVKEDGRYLWVHIGDGVILGVYPHRNVVLSPPENGDEPNQTFFLSGRDAISHMRCEKGRIKDLRSVMLCSDGISDTLWNPKTDTFASAVTLLSEWQTAEDEKIIGQVLERELNETFREHTKDDMSIALISFVV